MTRADVAQLVERNLAKVEVAGSNPVSRSRFLVAPPVTGGSGRISLRRGGRVVMQRTATPCMPVRFRPAPPFQVIDL